MANTGSSKGSRRQFGQVVKLPSGRWRARYSDPDGRTTPPGQKAMAKYEAKLAAFHAGELEQVPRPPRPEPLRYTAPVTYDTEMDAQAWLTDERRLISAGTWTPPTLRAAERVQTVPTLRDYAPRWLTARKVRGRPLAERTRDHYEDLLERHIYPTFGDAELRAITPEQVSYWYDLTSPGHPTTRAHAYSLLRSIMATAADPAANSGRPLVPFNPCGIRGGGATKRLKKVRPATAQQVAAIVEQLPERHRLIVLLADGVGLRFGEIAELRRSDIDTTAGVIHIERAVARTRSKGALVKAPKSEAGERDLPLPPHLLPAVREHLLRHAEPGASGLLFPAARGGHLRPSAFYGRETTFDDQGNVLRAGWGWYESRRLAGRPDLRLHDLRHGALTQAARDGATLAELMALAGHSTSTAALRYQHSSKERLAELARKRSEAAGWRPGDEKSDGPAM